MLIGIEGKGAFIGVCFCGASRRCRGCRQYGSRFRRDHDRSECRRHRRTLAEFLAPPEQLAHVNASRSRHLGGDRARRQRRCHDPFLLRPRPTPPTLNLDWLPCGTLARSRSTRSLPIWQAVNLDDQEVQLGQVRCHPPGQPFCRQRHEPARGRRLRGAISAHDRQIARWRTGPALQATRMPLSSRASRT
jgi:hypothetical protein